jgi:hypothetical protein
MIIIRGGYRKRGRVVKKGRRFEGGKKASKRGEKGGKKG